MSERPAAEGNRPLRPLLPAGALHPPKPVRERLPPVRSPRQGNVIAACDECRKAKSKCYGERPACRRCVQRRTSCHYARQQGETYAQALKRTYSDLQSRATAHEEIVDLLRNLSDQDAKDVLQRIRSGTDVTTILDQVRAGNLLLQLAVAPETRYRYEFPYRSEMPKEYLSDNPYLDSLVYEAASLYPHGEIPRFSEHNTSSFVDSLGSLEHKSLYLKPFHAAEVVDPLLINARPSLWTAVCNDDVLMRGLLGGFFHCEYHFAAAFQKDYFLEDMAALRDDFCSSLLVNIMLAYSCVCYSRFSNRAEYWNPHTLLYRFLAEAKRIWELEATKPRITTIQAGMLFNVFHNLCGLDEIGQAYRIQAIDLAHSLHLFDTPTLSERSDRIPNGRAFTAWALYSWEALVGFSFMLVPLLKTPPAVPLPDPSKDPQWYGEVWITYPGQSRFPSYFGQVFRAKCQFRVIMNEFCQAAHSKDSVVTIEKADELRSRLKVWYDNLPDQLLPRTIVLPGHLQLHMYYHHLILSIYEPLLDIETSREPSPKEIVADASKYLQTLVRLYYLRHGYDAMDLFIVIPLMLTGFHCLDAIDEKTPESTLESLRSTLVLVAKGLHNQRRNHYLAEALFRVIRGRMRPQEASLLKSSMNFDEDEADAKQAMVQTVRSSWPVSVVRKKEDLESHKLNNLVENYAHLNVEDDDERPESIQDETGSFAGNTGSYT